MLRLVRQQAKGIQQRYTLSTPTQADALLMRQDSPQDEANESPQDVAERQTQVIEKILSSAEEVILVCMHGRAIRILLCKLLGFPLSRMDSFEHANLGLYILEYSGEAFNIHLENSTKHLLD